MFCMGCNVGTNEVAVVIAFNPVSHFQLLNKHRVRVQRGAIVRGTVQHKISTVRREA